MTKPSDSQSVVDAKEGSARTPASGATTSHRPSTRRCALRRLLRADKGSVSVELAIITPLILLIMLGFSEMYLYMRAVSSVQHTAFTLADSIGQMSEIINDQTTSNANSLGSLWAAGALIAAPSTLQAAGGIVVTSICDATTVPCGTAAAQSQSLTALGTPTIYWQAKAPWNATTVATQETGTSLLPSTWPFRSGDSAIVVEVFYVFDPFSLTRGVWAAAPGKQTIYRRVYVRQRDGNALALVAS